MSQTATLEVELEPVLLGSSSQPVSLDQSTTQAASNHDDGQEVSSSSSSSSSAAAAAEEREAAAAAAAAEYPSRTRAYLIVGQLTLLAVMTSVSNGLIVTSIPGMALDLSIPPQTSYWPLSVYGLTSGASLLVAGAVADVAGRKRVFVAGNLLLSACVLACGLARTNAQLVAFRALQGVAVALCLPSSVGLLTAAVAPGRRRNLAFGCTGFGQPVGFSVGLVFGGLFIDTVGWRVGWYAVTAALFGLFLLGLYVLPPDRPGAAPLTLHALRTRIDWIGASLASASLAMLAYVLVQLSNSASAIHTPAAAALLGVSLGLMLAFVWWMRVAARRGYPVLLPNRLWRQLPFTGICIMVLLSYAVMQTMELFCTLFFQNVQGLSALQSSLRLLPAMVLAAVLELAIGALLHRVPPLHLLLWSSVICAGSPLLMALIDPRWPYWYAAFPAQVLQPLSTDVLFPVGLVVISEVFPDDTQALAGAVFNTAAQFGTSIGLALISVVAETFTQKSAYADKASPEALGEGYKAAFWTAFAWMLLTGVVAVVSLRKVDKVGVKRD